MASEWHSTWSPWRGGSWNFVVSGCRLLALVHLRFQPLSMGVDTLQYRAVLFGTRAHDAQEHSVIGLAEPAPPAVARLDSGGDTAIIRLLHGGEPHAAGGKPVNSRHPALTKVTETEDRLGIFGLAKPIANHDNVFIEANLGHGQLDGPEALPNGFLQVDDREIRLSEQSLVLMIVQAEEPGVWVNSVRLVFSWNKARRGAQVANDEDRGAGKASLSRP